jgi:hypothetical protein
MRNMLLLGASALVLSLTGVSAYAYDQPATNQPNYSTNSSETSTGDVQRPHRVLGAYVGYTGTDDAAAYPEHRDARSLSN